MQAQDGWLVLACPFAASNHARGTDRRPSFRIHANPTGRSGYHCFSCHEHGNVADLVSKVTAQDGRFDPALAAWAEALEIEVDFEEFETEMIRKESVSQKLDESVAYYMYPAAWSVRSAREYLLRRGVGEGTAAILELRFDPDAQRVMFPVKSLNGILHGFVGRSVSDLAKVPKYTYPPLNKSKHLLGGHLLRQGFPTIIVEGQFAYARLVEEGVREFADVAAVMGSKLSSMQASLLIEKGDPVHLLFDGDDAGDQGIFGRWDAKLGKYETGGAFHLLDGEVEVYAPQLPPHGDPDRLSGEEVYNMIFPE
jgi:DNA primase